jgi:hypothetical protein
MFMFNGCGTTLYGSAKTPDGQGKIATKWFCLLYVPIIPLKSYIVTEEKEGPNLLVWHSSTFSLQPLGKLYRKHLMVWSLSWISFFLGMYILAKLTTETPRPDATSRISSTWEIHTIA